MRRERNSVERSLDHAQPTTGPQHRGPRPWIAPAEVSGSRPRHLIRRPVDEGAGHRVRVDGKFFAAGRQQFRFRGVTYGTFGAREDGALFPERERMKRDLAAMREAGFTVVRTYTTPPDDMVDLAADWGLRIMAGVFYPDWRYLVGGSRRQHRDVVAQARNEVRAAARRYAESEQVMALSLGNEVPADVLRWFGSKKIAGVIDELVDVVREEDPDQLVTYANYPTAEYLQLDNLDFLTFNVFLERQDDFRKYLTRLHHLAGDRPLVLGEVGIDSGPTRAGENAQAKVLDWQLETATERGVAGTCVFSWTDEWNVGGNRVDGWHFGLTRENRAPKPALKVASKWNRKSVRDLDFKWPSMSVVICAYNAASTLDECLAATCALDYPGLEILVIDDGSTDRTADIARRYPRVRLVTIEHAGLSVARNEGFREAQGQLVAYLDSDAYPTMDWPYYLALGLDGRNVAGVGGPNLPPASDGVGAQQVARAPGGPVHVLVSDDRAEHVPGCNMAFWKYALTEVGGFDPIYTAAGDDVDLCWKVLDRGYEIGFHPAALVWHHRRTGLSTYLRQQRGYGRSEALVEARHPNRFTPAGTARWRGRIYNSIAPSITRQRVYRGIYGAAAYQSVYQGGGYTLDILHQAGIPLAVLVLATLPLGVFSPALFLPALAALGYIGVLGAVDAARATPPRGLRRGGWRFRLGVAAMYLLQPLHRSWGRGRARTLARRDIRPPAELPTPIKRLPHGVLLYEEDRPREELAAEIVTTLRLDGLRIIPPTGWEDHDARVLASRFVSGSLVTSSHPIGFVQARVRRNMRIRPALFATGVVAVIALIQPLPAGLFACVALADFGLGLWRTGPGVRRALWRASRSETA